MKGDILKRVAIHLLAQNKNKAAEILQNDYPFVYLPREKRAYSDKQKIKQFIKDGFIDRYSGQRLVNKTGDGSLSCGLCDGRCRGMQRTRNRCVFPCFKVCYHFG